MEQPLLPSSRVEAHHDPAPKKQSRRSWRQAPPEEIVLGLSYLMGTSLFQLPMENINGNPVPTVIFGGRPTIFHAFVIGICASVCGAVGAFELRRRDPKLAGYYRRFAVGAMALTLSVLLGAALTDAFRWVRVWGPPGGHRLTCAA
ncbi:hypothetical protein NMG60_11006272 [Bertholletia excelsa]